MERFRRYKEDGSGKYFRKGKEGSAEMDDMAAFKLNEHFYEVLGVSKDFKRIQILKKELYDFMMKRILTGDAIWENNVNIKRAQIEKLERKNTGGLSILEAKNLLDKEYKTIINLKDITIIDFYTKLKDLKNG